MANKTNVIPMHQQDDHEFTPLGEAVMNALDLADDPDEIAEICGEPVCVVIAMLEHLVGDGMVLKTNPKKLAKKLARRRTR